MNENELLNAFGNAGLAPFDYSDLIDQDKIARNDFFYFKQGVEWERSRILDFLSKGNPDLDDIIVFVRGGING